MEFLTQLTQLIPTRLDYFMLLLFRMTALLISSPIFGRNNVPTYTKIGLCFMMALTIYSSLQPQDIPYIHASEYWLLALKEIIIGLALGFVTNAFFSLMFWAGHMIDMQIGFGMVNIMDVQQNIQVPISGNMLNLMFFLVFFMIDGHLMLVKVLSGTLQTLPLGVVAISPNVAFVALEVFSLVFIIGVKIAMPLIAIGLVLEVAMGIIIRSMPQMNMFVVGIPLKIVIGFLILMIMIPAYTDVSRGIFNNMFDYVEKMFEGMMMV